MTDIKTIREKLLVANQTWIDYKGVQTITEWGSTKANTTFKKIQREMNCANPFDTRKARTREVLKALGYEQEKLVKDLEHDLNVLIATKEGGA